VRAARWWCLKCGREVRGVTPSLDPRYAIGRCVHGKYSTDTQAEVVTVVQDEATADRLIAARKSAAAYRRALNKGREGRPLSANEAAAVADHDRA
jgi:hypothetical protein